MPADISATMASLSATESSNSPVAATSVSTNLDDNLRMLGALLAGLREASGWGGLTLSSVAGTNTITASVAAQGSITMAPTAYTTGMRFHFIPAGANTGATTLNVNSLGAKNIFFRGVALGGGELPTSSPVIVEYDGTQFNLLTDPRPILRTEQATTSGTEIDFTSIPAWVKKITVQLVGVSTNDSSVLLIQLGDAGGIEATGYLGSSAGMDTAVVTNNYTTGFGITLDPTVAGIRGSLTLTLEDSSDFTWVAAGVFSNNSSAVAAISSGSKALSAALDRVRLTTLSGGGDFDSGAVNILLE